MKKYIGFAVILVIWELTRALTRSPLISSAWDIVSYLFNHFSEVIPHIIASVEIILAGFFIALFVGFSAGLLISYNRLINVILTPVVDLLRPISAIALFPLFLVVLGLGVKSKVAIIFWTAWAPILLNTVEGILRVDKSVKEAGMMDGARDATLYSKIIIPLAAPTIMTGIRIGMSGGWISLVAAEMLGSNEGLGFFVLVKSQSFEYPAMYAGILLISLVGYLMNRGLYIIQKKIERQVC
jgi:NitT/TauT family transport system permease protein